MGEPKNEKITFSSIIKFICRMMEVPQPLTPALSSLKTVAPAPATPSKSVNFKISPVCEKEREKFLTAKYGAHQMALIRKRLKVEMWIFDNLQELYETETELPNDVDIDLDEILDIEDENQRKKFIRDILNGSKSSKEMINKFIDDLLERAKTL